MLILGVHPRPVTSKSHRGGAQTAPWASQKQFISLSQERWNRLHVVPMCLPRLQRGQASEEDVDWYNEWKSKEFRCSENFILLRSLICTALACKLFHKRVYTLPRQYFISKVIPKGNSRWLTSLSKQDQRLANELHGRNRSFSCK